MCAILHTTPFTSSSSSELSLLFYSNAEERIFHLRFCVVMFFAFISGERKRGELEEAEGVKTEVNSSE